MSLTLDLSGNWNYRLDPEDVGLKRRWQQEVFAPAPFAVPGTTTTNGLGEPPQDATDPREVFHSLQQRREYLGPLWLQRSIMVPTGSPSDIELFLERVIFESSAWIDGHFVGKNDSLSTAHRFDLAPYARPGEQQVLTLRIDNRDVRRISDRPSAYTNETQTLWNGVVGETCLRIGQRAIRELRVFPDPDCAQLHVSFEIAGEGVGPVDCVISDREGRELASISGISTRPGKNLVDMDFLSFEHWNEFSPTVYTLTVSSSSEAAETRFGMRSLERRGDRLFIDGLAMFLRGTLDCCVFPETGFPPCDVGSYKTIFRTVKELGLNHVRYHSWCPPDAAFTAADEIGIYLSIEGPFWMDSWFDCQVGSRLDHYSYIRNELNRIVDAYGNHPSFCFLIAGNELSGDFILLDDVLGEIKHRDSRRLYSLSSNTVNFDREPTPTDDFFVGVSFDGLKIRGQSFLDEMVESTTLSYDDAVERAGLPIVAHELGQYAVFPDVKEIPLYDGALMPVNLEAVRARLEEKGLQNRAHDFTLASGHLAEQLYRDDIEATMRTRNFGGFQMLDLHDFPGQFTATVGLLNAFWQSKGLGQIDLHCGAVKPLVIMDKRQYYVDEFLRGTVEVFNYGPSALPAGRWRWELLDSVSGTSMSGTIEAPPIPQGGLTEIGQLNIDLEALTPNTRATLTVAGVDSQVSNEWAIWVYDRADPAFDEDVVVARTFDQSVVEALAQGRRCVLFPSPDTLAEARKGEYFPVFWSPVWFNSVDPCGLVVDEQHPALAGFPSRPWSELNWKEPLENSLSVVIDNLPQSFHPITEVVPNFNSVERLTNMLECRVGPGRLLVCTIDFDHNDHPSVRALFSSIVDYVNSDRFAPTQALEVEDLAGLFASPARHGVKGHDLAWRRTSTTDGAKSRSRGANRAVDGNPLTFWESIDMSTGHWWQVDLGEARNVSCIRATLVKPQTTTLTVSGSVDGVSWKELAVDASSEAVRMIQLAPVPARHVRITFDQPIDLNASLNDVQIF